MAKSPKANRIAKPGRGFNGLRLGNNLLNCKVLAIRGKAGTGKSQLLAFETRKLLDAGRTVLTIAGGIYCSDDPIEKQILDNLRADVSLRI